MPERRNIPTEYSEDCPACGSVRGVPCTDLRYRTTDWDTGELVHRFVETVHGERWDAIIRENERRRKLA